MNFLEFVNKRKTDTINKQAVNEAFKTSQLGRARELIINLLRKESGKKVVSLGNFDTEINNESFTSELFACGEVSCPICFTFNWLDSEQSSQIYSISFFSSMDAFFTGRGSSDVTVYTMGASIVYFLPLISRILNSTFIAKKQGGIKLTLADVNKYSKAVYGEKVSVSEYYNGALKHVIYEGLSNKIINETFKKVTESAYQDMLDWKKEKQKAEAEAKAHKNDSVEANAHFKQLNAEYAEIRKAIKGGAASIEEVKVAVERALSVRVKQSVTSEQAEQQLEAELKDPEQVFKELRKYVKMVANGTCPSLLLCGAPGVGKTFKVNQTLEAAGYVEGKNMYTIKGKCSTRQLYTTLYDYQNKGDIVVVDDADAVVGPHAPEDAINIFKAALDSTANSKGRLISYGVAGRLYNSDGVEIPKRFFYNGGVIILTNYNAGQLNSALKGRSFIQDIHFTTEQILDIVKGLMPAIEPETLSAKSKMKAYDYLCEMAEDKADMQISVRTFGICARIFECCANDPDFTDDDARSMIKEQMRLQARTTGKSY